MATSSRSFRRLGPPPLRYRTPSPPRYAVEPISPMTPSDTAIEALGMRWAKCDNASNADKTYQDAQYDRSEDTRKRGHASRGSMDAFASIALATSSIASHRNDSFAVKLPFGIPVDDSKGSERPSKRARSEKLPSPEWHRTGAKMGSRPATSYEQSADSRTLEAELLLNFSQAARFSAPWPSRRIGDSDVPPTAPSLNGTHGSVFGPLIDDQDPHNGTQYVESTVHKKDETPLGKSDSTEDRYLNGNIDSSEAASHQDSPRRAYDSWHIEMHSVYEPGHVYASTSTVCIESGLDPQSSDQGHEAVEEASLKTTGSMEAVQPNDAKSNPGAGLEKGETESGPLKDPNTKYADNTLPTNDGGTQSIKEDGVVATQGESGQEVRDLKSPPAHLAETDMTTGSKVASTDSEASTTMDASFNPAPALGGNLEIPGPKPGQATAAAICAACNFTRNSLSVENDNSSTSWISCDGCKAWFHFACAGFKSEREVRGVDKYRCRKCKPIHGPTTYVRKSSRAHTAIDYAGLHQGVFKTSDETPEHHYIKPIKDGIISFQPEKFARLRPELVTAEYFEKGVGMKEPVIVPAHFNPRPGTSLPPERNTENHEDDVASTNPLDGNPLQEDWFSHDPESQHVPDHGQDALDMVIPRDLTVRTIAELYGPEEKVEVIDVKSQNGEGKKWNMRRWADYYESSGNKIVRNVISLEVSQSKLGRLIRRPQIVRDLDLQDSVWPLELQSKGEYPRVQFYCLMSVADCFTDFHIDFGGSSVFYHILKGKKTFLFIPPKEKHLKKYEEWCMSPAQNWTFLADQTKECYRVDLAEGDTMLIPAGWIHAVWTPEDSLVIGGNFLTRLNYGMQLRIAQIEKATGVARKFRYPHFQRIHWYTALRYLEDDPIPNSVRDTLQDCGTFQREQLAHYDFDAWGENSKSGRENYHARYYSQAELEGLPDLTRYLLRTALIDLGSITDGITTEARNAVRKAIPRGHGEPLDIVKRFAMWSAWKRGESIPDWAFADAIPEGIAPETAAKLSAAAAKKAALEAAPRRHSARRASQQQPLTVENACALPEGTTVSNYIAQLENDNETAPLGEARATSHWPNPNPGANGQLEPVVSGPLQRRKSLLGTPTTPHRRPACEPCRRRRRACKHRDQIDLSTSNDYKKLEIGQLADVSRPQSTVWLEPSLLDELRSFADGEQRLQHAHTHPHSRPQGVPLTDSQSANSTSPVTPKPSNNGSRVTDRITMNASLSRGRSKACNDCRKSKRRCIHDEHGNIDPEKANEAAIPRPAATFKRRKLNNEGQDLPMPKKPRGPMIPISQGLTQPPHSFTQSMIQPSNGPIQRPAPVANMMGHGLSSAPTANMIGHSPNAAPSATTAQCSPSPEHGRFDLPPVAPLADDAELANRALHQLNKAIISPQLYADEQRPSEPLPLEIAKQTAETIDMLELVVISPASALKAESGFVREMALPEERFSQPAASSLVSPPESTHNDAGQTSPTLEPKPTPSLSSSRHSSRHPKQVQRYTPESGSARRASSSSVTDTMGEKDTTLIDRVETAHVIGGFDASPKRTKPRLSSENFADEESLRLIKELQAQDYGLRRRGRA